MLSFNVFGAETDAEGALLATSAQQAFINLRQRRPGPLPPPSARFLRTLSARDRALFEDALSCSAIGAPETVRQTLHDFIARTGADELMITSQVFDPAARQRSFEIAAQAMA